MNPVGDTFTVGIVLLLLIGAVAFYLYTRIGQVEKRINLLENILLDLKVATENSFLGFPPPARRPTGGASSGAGSEHEHEHEGEHSKTDAEEEEELLSEYVPKMPMARRTRQEEVDESDETLIYERALESALDAQVDADEDLDVADAAQAPSKSLEISSEAAPAAPKSEVHINKLETNYTDLTVKELRTLAQNRGITGVGKLSRKELIDALQKKDSGVVDGIEASSAGSAFESSLTADAATIDA
jgi:hypothetical protein